MKLHNLEVRWVHDKCPEIPKGVSIKEVNCGPRATICNIWEEESDLETPPLGTGMAVCRIQKDNWCRETGRKKSLARAMVDIPRKDRFEVWKDYFRRSPKYEGIVSTMKLNRER